MRAAGRGRGSAVAVGAVLIGLLALVWVIAHGDRDVPHGATGFAGLVEWLDANDVEARSFSGGGVLVEGQIGLRVLPLHDVDLTAERKPPTTREEVIAETSETDQSLSIVAEKPRLLPTLIVLPKWRAGVRELGVAHRDLLIPAEMLTRLARQIPGVRGRVRQDPDGYGVMPAGSARTIGLFHAQTLAGSGCEPVIGTSEALLLGRCKVPGRQDGDREERFWVLADPDLMDNHGLTLAGNAAVALDFVRGVAGAQPVVLDLTDDIYAVDEDWLAHQRSWADIARIFGPPFTPVWIAFGAIAALVLWRALVRYGPLARIEEGPRASNEVSIDARARLLRLAGQDAALMRAHFQARMQALAADLLGPHRPSGREPLAVLAEIAGRRAPGLAEELAEAARLPDGARADPRELLRRLDRFETCLQRIRDEPRRAAGAGG